MLPPDDQLATKDKAALITELKRVDAAHDRLLLEHSDLKEKYAALEATLGTVVAELAALKARLAKDEKTKRGTFRSATPFSKQARKANPKAPGRKPGQGKFTNRGAPVEGPNDEIIHLDAPLASPNCPECDTPLEVTFEEPTTIDIPAQPRRVIKKWRRAVGVCPQCGKRCLGQHPELPTDQTGATAHRVGVNCLTQTLWVHYCLGTSLRRAVQITNQFTGITLTQSAVTQAAEKLCADNGPASAAYEGLKEEIRKSPVVNTDDTGWAIGVAMAFVMGFFTKLVKFYAIRRLHRSNEVMEILGRAFRGLLGCDRGPSYDAKKLDHLQQQKCLSHLLKNIKEAMREKTGEVLAFGNGLSALLREALQLWHDLKDKELSRREFNQQGEDLEERLRAHLQQQNLADADAQRILDGIGLRHDNGQVLLFLKKPQIEPTNNMAERDLRGAVISRKNSQCSKNDRGADTFAKMKSIFETLRARKLQVIAGFKQVLLTGKVPAFEG